MELQGTIKKIFDTQTFNSGFQKREVIITTQEQYPQPISVEFLQEKINLLDSFSEGDQVKIGINIRGREWTAPTGEVKYFNSITGWRIERLADGGFEPTHASPAASTPQNTPSNSNPFEDEDDDLPF